MINLFTTYYLEHQAHRKEELMTALRNNLAVDAIKNIYILNEGGDLSPFNSIKIIESKIKKRPTYNDFFEAVNKISAKNINIIANADIYFGENIAVLEHLDLGSKCLAVSRWDIQPDGSAKLFDRPDSQDVWIFKGTIRDVKGDFPIGVPFCDNRILYELQQAGYQVLNPAFSIKSYHRHARVWEEYDKSKLALYIDPPYRYIFPHNFFTLWRTLYFNMTHQYKLAPYRYDIKRLNRWLVIRIIRKFVKVFFGKEMKLIGY